MSIYIYILTIYQHHWNQPCAPPGRHGKSRNRLVEAGSAGCRGGQAPGTTTRRGGEEAPGGCAVGIGGFGGSLVMEIHMGFKGFQAWIWGYVMVCDGMWWYVMVCDGMWWYVMVCDGMWWYVMVYENMWKYVKISLMNAWLMIVGGYTSQYIGDNSRPRIGKLRDFGIGGYDSVVIRRHWIPSGNQTWQWKIHHL